MGRPHRAAEGGYVYHVLNRANARMTIFKNDGDFEAFENVLAEAVERTGMRLLAYCVLPNHCRASAHFGGAWRFGRRDVMSCSVRQRIGIAAVIVITRRSSWLIKNCRTSRALENTSQRCRIHDRQST